MPTATSVSWHLSWPTPPTLDQRISSSRPNLLVWAREQRVDILHTFVNSLSSNIKGQLILVLFTFTLKASASGVPTRLTAKKDGTLVTQDKSLKPEASRPSR